MEKMFNARWWDYSYKKFNINGRICLDALAFFGVVSCAIMYFLNPFFYSIISIFKEPFMHILVGILLIGFLIDNITSFRIMHNLKDVSRTLKDNTEEMSKKVRSILTNNSRLYKRLVYAFPNINTNVKLQEWKDRLNSKIHEIKFPMLIGKRRSGNTKIRIRNIIINEKVKFTRKKNR